MTDEQAVPTLFDAPLDLDEPVLPYGGTSGWSGSDASRERAVTLDAHGLTAGNQRNTYWLVRAQREDGITWKELADRNGWHHGTASGVLSVLHKVGYLARLTEKRGRCHVYVVPDYINGREVSNYTPNVSARLLTQVLTEVLDDLSAGHVEVARRRVAATLHLYNALDK